MTTTCPICTMVKDEDNVICEDCNTKGLIEHGIQILKNQEKARKFDIYSSRDYKKVIEDAEKLERVDSLFAELEIPPPYDLWLAESIQIREHLKKEIEICNLKECVRDEEVLQVLQKIIKGEPQRITSTKEGRKALADFEAGA